MEMQPFVKQNLSDAVKKMLCEYIEHLDLSKGNKLPSENVIAKNYGVSRVTIRRALDELEQEGIILRIHGRGTFVNPLSRQFKINLAVSQELSALVQKSGYNIQIKLTDFSCQPCSMTIAKALEIPFEEPVYSVEKAYYADGSLAIVCKDYLPEKLFKTPLTAKDLENSSTYEVLKEKAGKLVAREWIQLKTILPSEIYSPSKIQKEFTCNSLLYFYGSIYSADNEPLIYGTTCYDTNYILFNLVRNIIAF